MLLLHYIYVRYYGQNHKRLNWEKTKTVCVEEDKLKWDWQENGNLSLLCISFACLAVSSNRIGSGAGGLGRGIKPGNAISASIPRDDNTRPFFSPHCPLSSTTAESISRSRPKKPGFTAENTRYWKREIHKTQELDNKYSRDLLWNSLFLSPLSKLRY